MPRRDMVCNACGHCYEVATTGSLKDEQTRCPQCRSDSVRQKFASYLRNGPLLDPKRGDRGNGRPVG
ncbi:MAG: hypothetical protein A2133_02950 [Actinobacteria bacterium RBG_16_64_13]|nr:MAG: hypothetical protein A2133_02950 [Actinobacteria bacterium RBG_16_64_13]